MRTRTLCVLAVGTCVWGAAPRASAQEGNTVPLPRVEASAGYAFMRDATIEENFPAGWYFSAAASLTRWFGLAGEISGAHKTLTEIARVSVNANLHTYRAGPRFLITRGRER